MTVRWKPLLILSGLFVVVALAGLMTIATVMGSRGAGDHVARARTERQAKEYEKAKLDYQIALKADPKNAALYVEMADLCRDWMAVAPAERKADLRNQMVAALTAAAERGPKQVEPRRRLLEDAIARDDTVGQVRWARSIAPVDPGNPVAAYVLAVELLDGISPDLTEARRHLKALDAETPRRPRADWVAARIAAAAGDKDQLAKVLDRARGTTLPEPADPVDRMALLRLRALDLQEAKDVADVAGRVEVVKREALAAAADPAIPSTRIARISLLIEDLQRGLIERGIKRPADREALHAQGEALDEAAEAIFKKSLAVPGGADLNVYLAYADHLRFRDHRDRCLKVALDGLASPAGAKQGTSDFGLGLHALAVEAYLANVDDAKRHDSAAPHIRALLDSKAERFQALGHLFQGAIDLERAGLVAGGQAPEVPAADKARLRASALGHLRAAANQLPDLAEAQARYGVALILNSEASMGRQYLQKAQRSGNLEPQYQIWTAWAVVQAGYPEDAEPIVARMLEAVEQGRLPKAFEGTLHLLSGEVHQARKSPAELKKAFEEYRKAFANGQDATPAVELRLAQMELMLGKSAEALKRLDWLASKGKAGPAVENLAVLTLIDLKRDADARQRLDAARAAFPESSELATLQASLLVKAGDPEGADRTLADFLAKYPDNVPAVQLRGQILAGELKRPADARKLLAAAGERSENSAPLVQLALLELSGKDFEAAGATIARIRQRWKEAATADLLDAQFALAKNDTVAASAHFDAALKKDPNNKLVQFYKAQLDGRVDPAGAAKTFEALAGENSIKELDAGLPLVTASQSALASLALESGDLDSAIGRYRQMLKENAAPSIARPIRWQIVAALAAKKDWPAAKAELSGLVNDPKVATTAEERVRAATYYRHAGDDAAALAQADLVLKADATYPGAVVTRAEILSRTGKHAEARETIRRAVDTSASAGKPAPAVLYLMMAAVESKTPPEESGFPRALAVLDRGLERQPESPELVKAKCRILTLTKGLAAGAAFVEAKAKADPNGPYRQILLSAYREGNDLANAERVAAEVAAADPKDAGAAATLVQVVASRAVDAGRRGDSAEARKFDDRAAALIAEDRARFKDDPTFLQLECELDIRRGETARALTLTQEIDAKAKSAAVGPLLRAQIFEMKGQARDAAAAYAEALSRNPRLPEARLQLARLSLQTDQLDEAVRQARMLQDSDPEKPIARAALLLDARATALQKGTARQVQANRARVLERLAAAAKEHPDFVDAAHLAAEIHLMNGDRARAVATLKAAFQAVPADSVALAMAVQYLAEPRGKGQPAPKADLDDARALAKAAGDADPKGDRNAALAAGFAKAGQTELALPFAEKAAAAQNTVPAHLSLGDLLLTLSEAQADQARARKLLDRALAEYDGILRVQPNLVDAVNNKAWILHSYLKRSQDALTLAQDLMGRVDPSTLPGEFYDTLGSIQEELGRRADAEASYRTGLAKAPDHPVLNFHMGQLLMADKAKARKAAEYLKIAQAGADRLPANLADKLNLLLLQVPAN